MPIERERLVSPAETRNSSRRVIQALSPGMINKIAAGEVIERPASVVKELVENALDAGAARVEINIERAGNDLIAVIDNGHGIPAGELKLALSPHATSKIADTDDLFAIRSFGFRGEALASIAEISQMVLRSAALSADAGAEIRADGGVLSEPIPIGMATGTTIEVRNLFFNTPVRRKYLKSAGTEFGHLSEAVLRLAIPNFEIHFILRHNGRAVYDLPPCEHMKERLGQIFGPEIVSKLIPIDYRDDNLRIEGFVGHPDLSRSSAAMQYLFLNRRYFRDKSLQHALAQGYRGLLTVGRYPVAFLELELPPDAVDCNIHPTKMEVRFLESQRIYADFLSAIREKFLQSDLRSRPANSDAQDDKPFGREPETAQNSLDRERSESVRREILDWVKDPGERPAGGKSADDSQRFPSNESRIFGAATGNFRGFDSGKRGVPAFRPFERSRSEMNPPVTPSGNNPPVIPPNALSGVSPAGSAPFTAPSGRPVIQIQNRYLVFEIDDGLAVIDQHALHERILYEKIKRNMLSGPLDSQRLLIPETVDLAPVEAAAALDNKDIFDDFGLPIESFGGTTILVSGYPAILEHLSPGEIFRTLLACLMNQERQETRETMLEAMMHQTACKAAVKGGDALRGDAITELLTLAEQEINAHHCPHGRPSILTFSVAEIDKMFKRT